MARKYHCDYCNITLKDNLDVRKKHLNGLKHRILRNDYYEKLKDPKIIIKEHFEKTPCSRIMKHQECKFGSFCRFSHYTSAQIEELQLKVQQDELLNSTLMEYYKTVPPPIPEPSKLKREIYSVKEEKDKNYTDLMWIYPKKLLSMDDLPPSLQLINLQTKKRANNAIWGPC